MTVYAKQANISYAANGTTVLDGVSALDSEFDIVYTLLNKLFKAQAATTAPTGPEQFDVWLDTTDATYPLTGPPTLKYYTGTAWAKLGSDGKYSTGIGLDSAIIGYTKNVILTALPVVTTAYVNATAKAPATLTINGLLLQNTANVEVAFTGAAAGTYDIYAKRNGTTAHFLIYKAAYSGGGLIPPDHTDDELSIGTAVWSGTAFTELASHESSHPNHPNHTGDVTSVGDGVTTIGALKVATGMLQDLAVTNAKIANGTIDAATKLANIASQRFLGRNTAETGAVEVMQPAGARAVLGYNGVIQVELDGGGAEIADNAWALAVVPHDCIVQSWDVLADQSGSIVVDIWKDALANFPPTVADTITASTKPTISTAVYASGSPTDWCGGEKRLLKGDVLKFSVDSCTTIQRAVVALLVKFE
jgi:hypothetical protein